MNHKPSSIRNIRTLKALRGDALRIDLGGSYSNGTLTAWMKKNPNSDTYRSFEVEDGRYLILTKEKASDYYENEVLVEAIEGRWYFDVEFLENGLDESESKTIYTGTIYFSNDITGSNGVEAVFPGLPGSEYVQTVTGDGVDNTDPYNPIISQLKLEGYFELGVQVDGGIVVALGDYTGSGNQTTFALSDDEKKIAAEAEAVDNEDEDLVQSGSFNILTRVNQSLAEGYTAFKVFAQEFTIGTGQRLLAHFKGEEEVKINSNGIVSSTASKTDMDNADNDTLLSKKYFTKETESTSTNIDLSYIGGNITNVTSPNTATIYSGITGLVLNGNQTTFTKTATEPLSQTNLVFRITGTNGQLQFTIVDRLTNVPFIYTVDFNTSLAQTATDFITSHAANILTNHNYVVESAGFNIMFSGDWSGHILPKTNSGDISVIRSGALSRKVFGAEFEADTEMKMCWEYNGEHIEYYFLKVLV